MQAIAISIGKNGINFFAQHYLVGTLLQLLGKLTPPDRAIPIPDFRWNDGTISYYKYSQISVSLANGGLHNFSPKFDAIIQGVDSKSTPIFTLTFEADNFSAQYAWTENYHWEHWTGTAPMPDGSGNKSTPFTYSPAFGKLIVPVVVQFSFDASKDEWEITVANTSGQTTSLQANIPPDSILQHEDQTTCASGHVSDATAQAIDAIDFATPINSLIKGIVATIPGSGDLGDGIVYDFSLGDSGLLFPNKDGIQMGVKGGASYNGTPFSGDTPPSLPLPPPPGDADIPHLNMYVSNYEVDALNWAYCQAGKLNLHIEPQDLPDPQALKVCSYTALEKSLKPYCTFVMFADVSPNAAPVTAFQVVYIYTAAVMDYLSQQLPADVYQLILGLSGNAFLSQSELDTFLTEATVKTDYFPTIENAGKTTAMVVKQDINFTLEIQNGQSQQPDIKFRVQRADVLTDLKLGVSHNDTQSLQFAFANASDEATFISSSIPGFDGTTFGSVVWPVTAEPMYALALEGLGKTGVPLPIMQGFQFVFDQAQLSVQEGYVSILANVEFQSAKALRAAI
jgi:hypothetical protein